MRYALGVGVGTPIVVLLWRAYGLSITMPSHFSGSTSALLWAAAGTAYCYVASIPMLTLHSTRRVLPTTEWWVRFCFISVAAALMLAGVCDLFLIDNPALLACIGSVALFTVAFCQLVLLWKVLRRPNKTRRFYRQLSERREQNGDFVESYRHMREHGNAVSIVLFELLLAFILWSLNPHCQAGRDAILVGRVGMILAVWLSPAALVWLIGSSLERYLSRLPVDQTAKVIAISAPEPQSRDTPAP